ncbi:MAG: c-type cytochrome, partial [Pedosphaera sp.]|nr:c-type cytochrome [Pedosphaera sp.]
MLFPRWIAAALFASTLLTPNFGAEKSPAGSERRLRVLFLGDQGHHQPAARFKQAEPVLSFRGFSMTYTERMADLNAAHLAQFDALMVFANINKIAPEQERAVLDFVAAGKGFVPVHCASFCFLNSPALIALTGAQFKSHGTGTFRVRNTAPDHPIMKGFSGFESWDETYVHHKHNDADRTVLESRDAEPWTWVRTHGKGRVFYTAWGHDERTWGNVGFHDLLERGLLWASGREVTPHPRSVVKGLKPFEYVNAVLPNYLPGQKPSGIGGPISQMQKPLPPEESRRHLVFPRGFESRLFAAEPDIRKPLAMAWDERGRLWLCESVNYPNDIKADGEGNDTIRICEDTDGDGRADRFTVFADKLNIPTGIAFARGGVVVHQAPQTLFLKDTDGDDKADMREVLLNGWSKGDTHAGPSNLRYGLDNWLWGMVGYSGFKGRVGGEEHDFRSGFYRFQTDAKRMEFLRNNNNNTWGLGFSEEGLVFGSTANGNPSVFLSIPNRYYESVRGWNSTVLPPIAETARFTALSDKVRQVDWHGQYTAAAGHALYTARTYPAEYWNRAAFVCEPTAKLIGTFFLDRDGANFRARPAFQLAASDDEWTAPIMAEVGPDGHMWFIDWYNYIVQHNPTPPGFKTGKGNAYETDLRDKQHARIYRAVHTAAPPTVSKSLHSATPVQLVAALSDDNQFWRLHAQRLLVERGKPDVRTALLELVRNRSLDAIGLNPGAIHALWTLHGLGLLDGRDAEIVQQAIAALKHPSAGVRLNAVRVLPRNSVVTDALLDAGLLADSDRQVRLQTLLALSESPANDRAGEAVLICLQQPENAADRWLPDAATAAAARHDSAFIRSVLARSQSQGREPAAIAPPSTANLVPNSSFEQLQNGIPAGWKKATYAGQAEFEVDLTVAHSGKNSLKITSKDGSDASWALQLTVKPNRRYRLSAWVRTREFKRNTGLGALMNLHQLQKVGKTTAIGRDADWTRVSSEFESGTNEQLTLNLLFGGWGQSKGEAWWDDVEVVELGLAGPPAISSLPGRAGEVVAIVTRHYAARGPVESVMATLAATKGADEGVAAHVLDGLLTGWPKEVTPRLSGADKAELSALLKVLSASQKDKLLLLATRWGVQDVAGDIAAVVQEMTALMTDEKAPAAGRLDAARRLIRLSDVPESMDKVIGLITPQTPTDLAAGLVAAVGESRNPKAGEKLLARWRALTPVSRRTGIEVLLRRAEWTLDLLESVKRGEVLRSEINAAEWQLLRLSRDARITKGAEALQASAADSDRQKVYEQMSGALKLAGDTVRGKELFTQLCTQCHSVHGQGGRIGPDLSGVGARPPNEILQEIVDPNRSLESNFRLWTIETSDDESISGRLESESRTNVEILDLTGKRHVIQRSAIRKITAAAVSIMPVGLVDSLPAK